MENHIIRAVHDTNHFHRLNSYAFINFIPATIKKAMMKYAEIPKQSFIRNCDSWAPLAPA